MVILEASGDPLPGPMSFRGMYVNQFFLHFANTLSGYPTDLKIMEVAIAYIGIGSGQGLERAWVCTRTLHGSSDPRLIVQI